MGEGRLVRGRHLVNLKAPGSQCKRYTSKMGLGKLTVFEQRMFERKGNLPLSTHAIE
jgi:hypothetical protein